MASKLLYEYKKHVNNKNTKNFKFVTVKSSHNCKSCGSIISKNTECLTVNKKLNGREWICEDCVENHLKYKAEQVKRKEEQDEAYANYLQAVAHQKNVAFGDEGAAMAMAEWVDECAEILDELGFFEDDWYDY